MHVKVKALVKILLLHDRDINNFFFKLLQWLHWVDAFKFFKFYRGRGSDNIHEVPSGILVPKYHLPYTVSVYLCSQCTCTSLDNIPYFHKNIFFNLILNQYYCLSFFCLFQVFVGFFRVDAKHDLIEKP